MNYARIEELHAHLKTCTACSSIDFDKSATYANACLVGAELVKGYAGHVRAELAKDAKKADRVAAARASRAAAAT